MSSYDSQGWSNRPPAIFSQPFAQYQTYSEVRPSAIGMVPLMLEPTTDPVWLEDEEREDGEARAAGDRIPDFATPLQTELMAREIRVALPDRLLGCMLKLQRNKLLPIRAYDYYVFSVPAIFSAPAQIIPRRLMLQLTLEDATDAKPPRIPVAYHMYPESEITTKITNLGEFKIDLGSVAIEAIKAVWPAMPDVVTARIGGSIDISTVQARIQTSGLNSHKCEWRIADTAIVYDFNPACVVQVPKGAQLAVNARLHVEARKKLVRLFYKSYFRTAIPMRYVLGKLDGSPLRSRRLRHGSKVTLRRPGVVYSDEARTVRGRS